MRKRNRDRCGHCNAALKEPHKEVGVCQTCAQNERKKIKKNLLHSAIGGAVFAAIVLGVITAVKLRYTPQDTDYIVYSTTFFMSVGGLLAAIAGLSLRAQLFIGLFCFLIPFGKYIKIDLYGPGVIGLAVVLMELIISVLSGPFIILFSVCNLIRLAKYAACSPDEYEFS